MNSYNNWAKSWKKQEPSQQHLPEAITTFKKGQMWTITILGLTVMILLIFMTYTFNLKEGIYSLGLSLMILSVSMRVLLEIISVKRLTTLSLDLSLLQHLEQARSYHRQRLLIHQWWTPAILIAYWTGFVLLIPTFKLNLTDFMFQYVCWSSIPIAALMIWFIRHYIRREQRVLKKVVEDLNS